MPVEMEAKLKVNDHAAVRQKLRNLGAKRTHERLETNLIFDAADRSLFASNKALRLRINHDVASGKAQAVLTFKGPAQAGQFKNRQEIETEIDDAKSMEQILKALG